MKNFTEFLKTSLIGGLFVLLPLILFYLLLAELLGRPRDEMTEPVEVGEGRALWIADDPGRRWVRSTAVG